MEATSPHHCNSHLTTLRQAALLPLRDVLDPYARLTMKASRSCAFAWLAVERGYPRDRLNPAESFLAERLEQARELLPRGEWRRHREKFLRQVQS